MRQGPLRWVAIAMGVAVGCAFLIQLILPMFGRHHPGGRISVWRLKDGTQIRFFIRAGVSARGETVKVLEVARPGMPAQEYTFAVWHAGYHWVELRTNDDESVVWLLDKVRFRVVGCSLVLATGLFNDEDSSYPIGVSYNTGRVLPRE